MKQNNLNDLIDEAWFAKIAEGDNDAFAKLYYASYKQLYGFLLSLCKNKGKCKFQVIVNIILTFIKYENYD